MQAPYRRAGRVCCFPDAALCWPLATRTGNPHFAISPAQNRAPVSDGTGTEFPLAARPAGGTPATRWADRKIGSSGPASGHPPISGLKSKPGFYPQFPDRKGLAVLIPNRDRPAAGKPSPMTAAGRFSGMAPSPKSTTGKGCPSIHRGSRAGWAAAAISARCHASFSAWVRRRRVASLIRRRSASRASRTAAGGVCRREV